MTAKVILLYCVFDQSAGGAGGPRAQPAAPLGGVDGAPVRLTAAGGLCAACSAVDESALVPDLRRVQAYEAVVESFFAGRPVVPMRYGSALESEDRVAAFLEERSARFRAQLEEVDGCVEMGIRVPAAAGARGRASSAAPGEDVGRPGGGASGPGRAWLAARRERLRAGGGGEGASGGLASLVEPYRRALAGLFVRFRAEPPAPLRLVVGRGTGGPFLRLSETGADTGAGGRLAGGALSLSFLVPRAKVEAFRRAFAQLADGAPGLLSGPWPPYSFV